ncbi:hypothetical protein [Collimonas humicola]|uniref:hypothetical protein n=1 Tax=Collimonas humicola TaxID=2825886 RepID=UPI001B8CE868|nr:hypothetical protein [Collimonas humicola]
MSEPTSSFAGIAFFKFYGLKVGFGMIGAALLYFVLPPVKKDGTFDRREFVARLAVAGLFSTVFGDWAVAILMEYFPRLHADGHAGAVFLLVGAPGWWISRAVALWFQNRRDKDIAAMINDAKDTI